MKTIGAALVGAGFLVSTQFAVAQESWNMATGYGDTFFLTGIVKDFIADVEETTEIDIQLHDNQSLVKLGDIKRAVQTGQVQLGEILLSQHGNENPLFELDNIPFFAKNLEEWQMLWTALRPAVAEALLEENMRLLYVAPWPTSGFYMEKPLNSIEELEGVRIRTYNNITRRFFELTESVPTIVQFSEVPQAFATGLVDAMFTAPQLCLALQCWDFVNSFTHVGSHIPSNVVVLNEDVFQALDEAIQQELLAAGAAAEKAAWERTRAVTQEQLDALASNGMTVTEGSPELIEALSEIGEVVLKEWLEKAGETGDKVVEAYRAM